MFVPDSLDGFFKYKIQKEAAENEILIERVSREAERAKKGAELAERCLKLFTWTCAGNVWGILCLSIMRKGLKISRDIRSFH